MTNKIDREGVVSQVKNMAAGMELLERKCELLGKKLQKCSAQRDAALEATGDNDFAKRNKANEELEAVK